MLAWFSENMGTIIICAILAAVVALIVIYKVRQKKKGVSSCGCGCGCGDCPGCTYSASEGGAGADLGTSPGADKVG